MAGVHKNGFTFVACGTPTAQCLEKVKDLSEAQWDDIITKAQATYREDNSKGAVDIEDGSEEDDWDNVMVQESSDGSDDE
jgi:arsenate reductase-like glutaredoxin family protein